jgi:acetyl esterase/lipase
MHDFDKPAPDPTFTECFASPGGQDLMTDIYVPDTSRSNGAAVLLVHGGGWNAGKRQSFLWHAHCLSMHGYVACTIDYRLAATASFPAALVDCQSAVRWLRRNAGRFGISANRIGALGSSAGGHLVACLGVLDNTEDTVSAKVDCVVDVHGVHDLVSSLDYGQVLGHWEAFMGGPISEKRESWIAASPALHVDGTSAPMLLVHDPQDATVPYDQSLLLAAALARAGRPMQFLPSPGSGHGFVYNPKNASTRQVWPVAVAWFDQHLRPSGSTPGAQGAV